MLLLVSAPSYHQYRDPFTISSNSSDREPWHINRNRSHVWCKRRRPRNGSPKWPAIGKMATTRQGMPPHRRTGGVIAPGSTSLLIAPAGTRNPHLTPHVPTVLQKILRRTTNLQQSPDCQRRKPRSTGASGKAPPPLSFHPTASGFTPDSAKSAPDTGFQLRASSSHPVSPNFTQNLHVSPRIFDQDRPI